MTQTFLYTETKGLEENIPIDRLPEAFSDVNAVLWIDLEAPTEDEINQILRDICNFHPLAIEDCVHDVIRPKFDDFGDYLFMVLHAINFINLEQGKINTLELDLFLGKNTVVTVHKAPLLTIQSAAEYVRQNPAFLAKGADALLHRIIDALVDNYQPIFDQLRNRIDNLESEIFESHQSKNILARISQLKKDILYLKRILSPQWDTIRMLAEEDFAMIDAHQSIFFSDINDHIARWNDFIENYRELVNGILDTHISLTSHRLNDVMRVLTVIATIMMPLTLLVGIYGMNFEFMPELKWHGAYFTVLGLMVVIVIGMVYYFKTREWM
jgi:magnesium transporter